MEVGKPNEDKLAVAVPNVELASSNHASEFHKKLVEMIIEFENGLDAEHEVGMRLVTFGQSTTFHVSGIGYNNPSLIRFYGKLENGSLVELIQHVSQISFLLMAVKPLNNETPQRLIGFLDFNKEE